MSSAVLAAASPISATAQDWAQKMFKVTDHDFGTVARDAKVEFSFPFTNLYLEDVHVAGVRSSCGCTSPRCETPDVKTYETGAIIAHVNTDAFLGQKGATLTVTFDKPSYAEVQLHVRSYIRSDVVFQPGSVQFGAVREGKPAESHVLVNFTGNDLWRVAQVRGTNQHLSAALTEKSRFDGQVNYDLLVRLDGKTPPGYLSEYITLMTNDGTSTQIPLKVEARIESSLTVSPTSLFLGTIEPQTSVTKQFVLKGERPFRVLAIECPAPGFTVPTSVTEAPAKPVHVIPVTFKAGTDAGRVAEKLHIKTDLGDATVDLPAFAVVAAPKS